MFRRSSLLKFAWLAAVILISFASHAASGAPKLPEMKTPEAKLQALEYFRTTGPWKSIKHTDSFSSKELDKLLEHDIKLPEDKFARLAQQAEPR
jgi:hypothetical protein